jgi:hypothetical protein
MTTTKQLEEIAKLKAIIDKRIKRVSRYVGKEAARLTENYKRKRTVGRELGHCSCGAPFMQTDYLCKICYDKWNTERQALHSHGYLVTDRLRTKLEDAITRSEIPRCAIAQATRALRGELPGEPRQQKFNNWLQQRRQERLVRLPKSCNRFAVCTCGQPKPLSANYCFDCQDARRVIKMTTPLTSSARVTEKAQNYVPKIVTSAIPVVITRRGRRVNIDYDKTVNPDYDNNGFDNLVKLYEDCRD